MFSIQRILFPVDFSARSRAAGAYAEEFARHFNASLTLLHVVEPPDYNTSLADSHRTHSEGFDQFFKHRLQRLHVKQLIEHGDAAQRIVECAARENSDLIMLPTQGLGVYRRLIIGSTSAKVLHDADCAVWSGVHWEHVVSPEKIHYRQICCAVDLSPHSAAVLEWAHQFSKAYDAKLTLLHAGERETALPGLEQLQSAVGSSAEIQVIDGDPVKTIARMANQLHADTLVIGRGAESGILGRLVTTAYSLIRQSPCPVVSV